MKENDTSNELPPLTPQQIENWRKMLFSLIGPYALIAPPEDIQRMRDDMQRRANEDAP